MCVVQSRSIICAITCYCHNLTSLLKKFYQSLLITRSGSAHNPQLLYKFEGILICHSCKIASGNYILFRIFFISFKNPYLSSYLHCSRRSISSYNFHIYTCTSAPHYCSRNIRSYRIRDCHSSKKLQPSGCHLLNTSPV
ncbi:hypothetical protein SDC9_75503 [bioreactor metagenome]|uniref:Uncharacterized protein n=1 Tax=bioreactor metagenome TaxID=1076179 RepID=A0A644YK58_9ZZZZ